MKKLILIGLLVLFSNCATGTNRPTMSKVFGGVELAKKDNNVNNNATINKEGDAKLLIEVVENVYPPASYKCIETIRINGNNEQCINFITWDQYVSSKYTGYKLDNLSYDYTNKIMTLFIKKN